MSPGTTGAILGGRGVSAAVGYLSWWDGGALATLCHQWVCQFCAVQFWQGRYRSVWFSQTIARCLSITSFASLCQGCLTPLLISSQTSTWGVSIRYCISCIAACKNLSLAILAIFKTRHMSDCSSCSWPPCPAIVAGMLETFKKFVSAFTYEIRL